MAKPDVIASCVSDGGTRTLLIICQVYPPDPAAVGQQMADVAEAMARRGWRVIVYTSRRGYENAAHIFRAHELRNGVDVRRLPLSSFGKRSIAVRLFAQSLFMLQAMLRGFFTRHLRLVLVSTSPPFAGFGGALIAWLRGVALAWWVMDLNPDQMVASGKISSTSVAARLFDWMNACTLRRAQTVVVLDTYMKDRLHAKHPDAARIHVLPPWPHDAALSAHGSSGQAFRELHGLANRFVVMYSGNHALQHPLTTLLDAAKQLEDDPRLLFVFIGDGAGKAEVNMRIAAGAPNLRSLPFQPLERLGESLSAADVHAVTMGDEVVGIVHPCKIYGALAIGRPILFFGPTRSHAGDILASHPFGHVIRHGDVKTTVEAVRELSMLGESARNALGDQARTLSCSQFSQDVLVNRFCDLLEAAGAPQRPVRQLPAAGSHISPQACD